MEIKIGIKDSARELHISSTEKPEVLEKRVLAAVNSADGVFQVVDEQGRRYIVPGKHIAYAEISASAPRKVGFAVGA